MTAPARRYLAVSGVFLLVVGVVGFALDRSFPTSPAEVAASHGHIFGIFETNGWHNLAAVGLAVASLAIVALRPTWSVPAALASGAGNAGVFVLFAVWDPATFLVASNAADQVMHSALAVGGLVAGVWGLRGRENHRRQPDQRRRTHAVRSGR